MNKETNTKNSSHIDTCSSSGRKSARTFLVLLALAAFPHFSQASALVSYGPSADYVAEKINLARSGVWTKDGSGTYTYLKDFSDSAALSPSSASGYSGPNLYGGYSFTVADASGNPGTPQQAIYDSAHKTTYDDIVLQGWAKSGSWSGTTMSLASVFVLKLTSPASITELSASVSNNTISPFRTNTRWRWVVQVDGTYYVSETTFSQPNAYQPAAFSLADFPVKKWAVYAPDQNLNFDQNAATYSKITTSQITAVGLYVENDSWLGDENSIAFEIAIESFTANGTASPGAKSAVLLFGLLCMMGIKVSKAFTKGSHRFGIYAFSIALTGTWLPAESSGQVEPNLFRHLPPNEESLRVIRTEILHDYFYRNYVQENPQHLPQSAENPLGYSPDGAPWKAEWDRAAAPVSVLDIPGPDGLIYPNFSFAGVQGGIPVDLPIRVVIAEDNGDFAGQLEQAIERTAQAGGGVIQIESGRFVLTRPVRINANHVVIRGRSTGKNATVIQTQFGFSGKNILWLGLIPDAKETVIVGPRCEIGIQASVQQGGGWTETPPPYGELELAIDGKVIASANGEALKQDWFVAATGVVTCKLSGQKLLEQGFAPGKHTAVATAKWGDGTSSKSTCEFILDTTLAASRPLPRGMIDLLGTGFTGSVPISAPLPRGTTTLSGVENLRLTPGDFIRLNVTPSQGWLARHKITNKNHFTEKHGIFQITTVLQDGSVVLNQPLRFSVDEDERVKVEKMNMLQGCGIENIVMENPVPNALHNVYIRYAANSWVKNLKAKKPGTGALWGRDNKWIEVRDLEVDDGWYHGGGMAYVGWEDSYDCLLDGAKGRGLRHAPVIQYSSSGCVIRNGQFEDSDGQFHSGWPHENLIENCTIKSKHGKGSYGFGFIFAVNRQPGPRNVLYNNEVAAETLPALFIGGPCEGSMFLYNKFSTQRGPAVYMQYGTFNQTFLGNYLVSAKPQPGFVFIASPDCTGNEFIDNKFGIISDGVDPKKLYFYSGAILPESVRENTYSRTILTGRPSPKVNSLYEWQVNTLRK